MAADPTDSSAQERERELVALLAALFSPLAHDLRAGLNGISVWTHLLASDGSEVSTRALEGIRRAVAQQSALAQELSQFGAALNAHATQTRTPVDLVEMCRSVAAEVQHAHPNSEIASREAALPAFSAYADLLHQLLHLLLTDLVLNAPQGSRIELTLRADGNEVSIELESGTAQQPAQDRRRRTLRQSLAALAAHRLGGHLDIAPAEPVSRFLLRLPS
jgi:signal transduction histidine kinase